MSFTDFSSAGSERADIESGARVPVVVVLGRDGRGLVGTLVTDCEQGEGGATFPLIFGSETGDRDIRSVLEGTSRDRSGRVVPGTRDGDVVVFDHGVRTKDGLFVGDIVFRAHDGLDGPAQVVRAPARPTRYFVSKGGFGQTLEIADPAYAIATRSVEEMGDLLDRAHSRAWPGGRASILVLDADGRNELRLEWSERRGSSAIVRDAVEMDEISLRRPVRAIPVWRHAMGRDHSWRETDPRKETSATWGAVSGKYVRAFKHAMFRDTFMLVGNEDEWTFGAPTGKTRQVVLGMIPFPGSQMQFAAQIAPGPGSPDQQNRMKFFFKDEMSMTAAMEARLSGRSDEYVAQVASDRQRTAQAVEARKEQTGSRFRSNDRDNYGYDDGPEADDGPPRAFTSFSSFTP